MNIRTLTGTFAALGLGLAVALPASAGSVVQTQQFEFQLLPEDIRSAAEPAFLNGSRNFFWFGETQKLFNPFDSSQGTLNKTTLSVQMNISGTLFVFDLPEIPDFEELEALESAEGYPEYPGEEYEGPTIQAFGAALSGPLEAEVDFGDYQIGEDGELVEEGIEINESGDGEDMTSDLTELGFFQGTGDVPVDLLAALFVDYGDTLQIGGDAESFTADGQVTLRYDFTEDEGDSTVIPSPAALPAGLIVLGGLALRRRRTNAAD